MTVPDGYNPMRWDCEKQGCWKIEASPAIELFSDCFPRKIAMSDLDGVVEIKGKFLLLEWKSTRGDQGEIPIPRGQEILFHVLTQNRNFIVFVVWGDPKLMTAEKYVCFWGGKRQPDQKCDLGVLKDRFRRWAIWADGMPP